MKRNLCFYILAIQTMIFFFLDFGILNGGCYGDIFCDVAQCSLVDSYHRLEGTCCIHLQSITVLRACNK
jgi:hypothetical protein